MINFSLNTCWRLIPTNLKNCLHKKWLISHFFVFDYNLTPKETWK